MCCWVALTEMPYFLAKKGDNDGKKGYNSTRIEEKGVYLYEFRTKKELLHISNSARHTLTAVCPILALKLRGVPFFCHRPLINAHTVEN